MSSRIGVRRTFALGLLLCAAFVASARGAEASPYRVGPGDVLHVEVWNEPDLSGDLRVDDSGAIHPALVGTLPAADRTCKEIAAQLAKILGREYLREARVVVTLRSSARRRAAVLGAVVHPGTQQLHPGMHLLDLLLAAGGPSPDADSRATLLRFGEPGPGEPAEALGSRAPRKRLRIDLGALLSKGDPAQNPAVEPGDVLVVARRAEDAEPGGLVGSVRVVGEVKHPGRYPLSKAPTALDAVLAAGGFTDFAAGNRARLVRHDAGKREVKSLPLDDIVKGRPGAHNVTLHDGDLLVVPESYF